MFHNLGSVKLCIQSEGRILGKFLHKAAELHAFMLPGIRKRPFPGGNQCRTIYANIPVAGNQAGDFLKPSFPDQRTGIHFQDIRLSENKIPSNVLIPMGSIVKCRHLPNFYREVLQNFLNGCKIDWQILHCKPSPFVIPGASAPEIKKTPSEIYLTRSLWRRRRDLNPRYPFGVYTISNRARSASYATSPCVLQSQPA